MLRRTAKMFAKGALGIGVFTGAVLVPPVESLPEPLFRFRVTCEGFGRMMRCVKVGAQIYWWHNFTLPADATEEQWDAVHERTAQLLLESAFANGGMYIKTCQNFSTNSHIIPPIYVRVLRKSMNAVWRRPMSEIRAVIQKELGKPIEEVFETFDEESIAAASLAQVHRATIRCRTTGAIEEVAVKVRYIDIAQRYSGDFLAIIQCLRVAGILFPGFDFSKLVKQGEETLKAELDFEAEAENLEIAGHELRAEFGESVTTPFVYRHFSTKGVLVTEFIDGVHPDDLDGFRERGIDIKEACRLLCDAYAFQMMKSGRCIQADPHTCNQIIRNKHGRVQCVLFDFGLAFDMTKEDMRMISEMWCGSVMRDDATLSRCLLKLDVVDPTYETIAVLGSMWLGYPYSFYDPSRRKADPEHIKLMRERSADTMPLVTSLLEKFPQSYLLCLRNVSTFRHVVKMMGRPVSRANRMLRYALRNARGESLGWFQLQWTLLQLEWNEFWSAAMLRFVTWWSGRDIEAEIDDALTVG